MAITSVKEIQDGRDGSQNIEGVCTYTRTFRVITSDPYDEAEEILSDGRLPMVGAPYPYNSNAYLESLDAKQDGQTKRFWTVSCKYTTKRNSDQQKNENPYYDPPEISWTSKKTKWPATVDAFGNPVVNSLGEQFQVPPEVEKVYASCVYKRNVLSVTSDILEFVDTINASPVTIDRLPFSARQCLCDDISIGGWKTRNNIWYREVTVNILIDSGQSAYPHALQIADMGMHAKQLWYDTSSNREIRIGDVVNWETGMPSKVAQPLDGNGFQNSKGDYTITWLYFQMHTAADWSPLRLV